MIVSILDKKKSILNKFISEIRSKNIQGDSMRFRRNIERIGEILAYKISEDLDFENKKVETPLGISSIDVPKNNVVLCSILRAGLPLHNGLLNYFDDAENAFISAYRKHITENEFEIKVEYFASPDLQGKTLILADPMLATGRSLVNVFEGLKKHGIPTIHYVSPSIWAWRGGRIHKIKRAVTHMLVLFPFEPALYEAVNMPVTYVGHPLADELPLKPNKKAARAILKLEQDEFIIAMLPGSRQSEVEQHAELLVQTAELMSHYHKQAKFLVPLITRETRNIFEKAIEKNANYTLNLHLLFGHAHDAMEAADFVIVASGTATLEAALLKRPMIITYRMPQMSWLLLKPMHYLPYVGLPNVLANKFIVPELLQKDATPEKLTEKMNAMLEDTNSLKEIKQEFTEIHRSLKQNSAKKAAKVVLSYLP